jgi:molecular chaperone GrpE (heat shock protein)
VSDSNVWLSCFLSVSSIIFVLSLLGKHSPKTTRSPQPYPALQQEVLPSTRDRPQELQALQQQCARLRDELHHQHTQLTADFQAATFEQLQPLLINYPTAHKMAQTKPDLPAKNLVALFTSLDNLLQTWQIEAIGSPWESVSYNPQLHQPDADDFIEGESVYVRFVGYRHEERILCPAKVSRTLPSLG